MRPVQRRVAAVLTLILAGCGTGTATGSDAGPSVDADLAPLARFTEEIDGSGLLDFDGTTLDGAAFRGADLAGKPVALWFWAPWCPNCNEEAPSVVQSSRDHDDVTFVGVAGRDDTPAMEEFVATYGITFPTLVDPDGSLWQRFGVLGQPAWVFFDGRGHAYRIQGGPTDSERARILDDLVTS